MTYDPIDTNNDGVVDADVDNQSVNTEQATVTDESIADATLESNKEGLTAGEWHQIADTEIEDALGELDSNFNFSPKESGKYDVEASFETFDTTQGDPLLLAVRDVDAGSVVTETLIVAAGVQSGESVTFTNLSLDSDTDYQVMVQNQVNSFSLGSANDRTRFTFRRSIIE